MSRSVWFSGLLATLACAGFVGRGHAAPLLVNGDFEAGDLSGWSVSTTANGLLGTPQVLEADMRAGVRSRALRLVAGQAEYAEGQAEGGSISQRFEVNTDGLYRISADFAVLGRQYANHDAGTFSLLLDGITVATRSLGGIDQQGTLLGSLDYSGALSAGQHDLAILVTRTFLSVESNTPIQLLDNVAISAVPEPSGFLCALLGMGALAGLAFTRSGCATRAARCPSSA